MTRKSSLCPISRRPCKLCALFRGRHYYALASCQEYMQRLHQSAAQRAAR